VAKERVEYLGTTLSADVHDHHELVKRIAMAQADFLALSHVWHRSSLTWKRKLALYHALVESKLLHGLSSICLTMSQERKLNGFQNRCLRSIIKVPPSFVSRVSNAEVLNRERYVKATDLLQKRQLQLLGKVLRCPEDHPLRGASFIPGTNWQLADRFMRRRGRPCKEWFANMLRSATAVFGDISAMERDSCD